MNNKISIKISIYFILNFLATISIAQSQNFSFIDNHATKAPKEISHDIDKLTEYLIKPAKNDLEKVRSFYVWISYNISYDMKGYLADKYPPYDVPSMMSTHIAICQGFANLFEAFCKKANIPVYVVDGYSKGYGYIENQKFGVPDHAWNAVKINDKWFLLDVTWDCINTNMPEQFPSNKFQGDWFLVPYDEFMVTHIPSDPIWQLSNRILTIKEFEKAKTNAIKLEPTNIAHFKFEDSVQYYLSLDSNSSKFDYARRSSNYNSQNSYSNILLGIHYYNIGYQTFKNINYDEYEKNHKYYDSIINANYDKSMKYLALVKSNMKFYKEAKEMKEQIANFKINTSIVRETTSEKNYKTNNNFNVRNLSSNINCEIIKLNNLNSNYPETNLSLSPDGNLLFFQSSRGGLDWSELQEDKHYGQTSYDGDIWYSKKVEGVFQEPVPLDNSINTNRGEDEPNISPDGKKIIFQSWRENWTDTDGPYYIANLNGTTCSKITGLGGGIHRFFLFAGNSRFDENIIIGTDGATMSPSGRKFIVSYSNDYHSKKPDFNLFISNKENSGEWSKMEPLKINTDKDERTVFLASDDKTLFFSSNGLPGFGGMDIFKTTIDENGNIGEIINLGSKINSKQDEFSFIMNANGDEAFFVRNGDIHQVKFTEPIKEITPQSTIVITGTISHNYTEKLLFNVKIFDAKTNKNISTTLSNIKTNEYNLLVSNTNNKLIVRVFNGNILLKEALITCDSTKKYQEIIKNFEIENISNLNLNSDTTVNIIRQRNINYESGIFSNIHFKHNSFDLEPIYYKQLDSIAIYLNRNLNAKLSISGYSDIFGSIENKNLYSQKRAESIFNYLVKKNIPKNRLILYWYADNNPITLDNTIAGGWLNRRVEFLIINTIPRRIK